MNPEFTDVQPEFRKGRGTIDQIANFSWIIEKAREFQKNIYFCFIDYTKASDYVDDNKLENSSRDGNTRPPDLPPEKSVCRSGRNSYNWTWNTRLDANREIHQDCILSPCLFNLYAEYIMQMTGLDEAQVEVKIASRNSNNFRYAEDTTHMSESEDDLRAS